MPSSTVWAVVAILAVGAPVMMLEVWRGGTNTTEHLSMLLAFFTVIINQVLTLRYAQKTHDEVKNLKDTVNGGKHRTDNE